MEKRADLILKFMMKGEGMKSVGVRRVGFLLLLLVLPICAGVKLPMNSWLVPGWMLVMSVVAWVSYGIDKKAAANGTWRISESRLHLMEILGGWPGAYLAQQVIRHKSRKLSYRVIFWGIVFLYQVVALDVFLDHKMSGELMGVLIEFAAV